MNGNNGQGQAHTRDVDSKNKSSNDSPSMNVHESFKRLRLCDVFCQISSYLKTVPHSIDGGGAPTVFSLRYVLYFFLRLNKRVPDE